MPVEGRYVKSVVVAVQGKTVGDILSSSSKDHSKPMEFLRTYFTEKGHWSGSKRPTSRPVSGER